MKVFLLLSFLPFVPFGNIALTQNLISNPGFEDHGKCLGLNTLVKDWHMPEGKYYHYLSDCPVGRAQYNGEENNKPFSGKCIAGICLHSREAGEYMLIKLNDPLKTNQEYFFSGYILLAAEMQENYKNFTHLEAAFTEKEYSIANPSFIFFDPQLSIPVSFEKKENEWIYISGRFTAAGNENYLIIGNFLSEKPISDELSEYMSLAPDERENYLRKHKKLEAAMNEFNSDLSKNSKPYAIRCYFDELCLMPAADSLNGFCNYPVKSVPPARKIETFCPIVIENIFFETGKSDLLPNSFKALDSLSNWLKSNPSVEIRITGHTDNKGNEKENNKLSAERAAAVKNYLISKGANNHIESSGMGSTKPVDANDSEEGRSKNRRVEFVITKE
jgi:outer membrane protein OmpA-like peptidoglycan-associated protein